MKSRRCNTCNNWFRPGKGGHNARYCGINCKAKAQYRRYRLRTTKIERRGHRRKSWKATAAHPARLAAHLTSSRKSIRKVRAWLASYKLERGCLDCGFKEHFSALQLDHEGPKTRDISDCRSSVKALEAEIRRGRCVVRCANCHSIKTWKQKNGLL